MDQNNIISPLLFAVGGSNVAITGIFAFLGYIWSRRILQKEKLDHDKKLAELKSELDFEKSRKEKISDERFSLYTAVWHSLQDLHRRPFMGKSRPSSILQVHKRSLRNKTICEPWSIDSSGRALFIS